MIYAERCKYSSQVIMLRLLRELGRSMGMWKWYLDTDELIEIK
jgi:hypothetical protein